jgi:hypothetical protein
VSHGGDDLSIAEVHPLASRTLNIAIEIQTAFDEIPGLIGVWLPLLASAKLWVSGRRGSRNVAPVNNTEEVDCLGGEWAERALEPNRMTAQGTSEAHLVPNPAHLVGH